MTSALPAKAFTHRFLPGLLRLLPATCCLFFAVALLTAVAAPILRRTTGTPTSVATAAAYLSGFILCIWGLRKVGPTADLRAAWLIILLAAILRFTLAFSVPTDLPLNTDQALFRKFAITLADQGRNLGTLGELSRDGDYFVWAGRVFPIHEGIRKLFGQNDLHIMRAVNVTTSVLVLMLVLYATCVLLPSGTRRWPVFFLAALPFQTYWVADYTHHLYSSTYLFAFACALLALTRTCQLWRKVLLSGTMSLLLLLMRWHGGIDRLAIGLVVGTGIIRLFSSTPKKYALQDICWSIVVPIACMVLLAGPLLLDEIRVGNRHQMDSHGWGFLARGWCQESGGEYYAPFEQMMSEYPPEQKPLLMKKILLEEIRDTPIGAYARLPVIKTGKLFLVGYANNWEESLQMLRSPALPILRGLRQAGAIAFLFFVFWGSLELIQHIRSADTSWLMFLLLPLLAWGAYVVCGETSPRYSVYVQPVMALMAGVAFLPPSTAKPSSRLGNSILPITLAMLLLISLFAAIRLGAQLIPSPVIPARAAANASPTFTSASPSDLLSATLETTTP